MRIFTTILILAAVAVVAFGGDPVPVYGPARVGVEDPDLLADTVLDVGVLAVSSYDLTRVVIGDGITPGGVEIHPAGCVRGFGDISDATTNLNMRTYAIQWGPWQARGDLNALSFTYGPNDLWMRFVRDTGSAYLPFNLTIGDGVFQFTVPSVEGMPEPVLHVTTNLLEDFAAAPAGTYGTSRPNAAQLVIAYTNATDRALFFRIFDAAGLRTGVYHYVPVVATAGITMGTNTWTDWPDVGAIAANAAAAAVLPVAVRTGVLETNAATHATKAELAAVAGLAATNAGNIYSNSAGVSWVTNALGQRISAWETVSLFVRPSAMSVEPILLPTNLPTRSLEVYVNYNAWAGGTNPCRVHLAADWNPLPGTHIKIIPHAGTATNVALAIGIGTNHVQDLSFGTSDVRLGHWYWLPELNGWRRESTVLGAVVGINKPDGTLYLQGDAARIMPSTIEEWVAWRNQQTW